MLGAPEIENVWPCATIGTRVSWVCLARDLSVLGPVVEVVVSLSVAPRAVLLPCDLSTHKRVSWACLWLAAASGIAVQSPPTAEAARAWGRNHRAISPDVKGALTKVVPEVV